MVFSINSTNNFSTRSIGNAQDKQKEAIERLSTMLRINSAKDDAAGSAIFQRQTSGIRGANQAIRNASDGISFVQTAQGSLSNVSDNLQRMRELAVQAANSTTTSRGALQTEVNQLSQENTRVNGTSSFAGQAIFPPESQNVSFQVGAEGGSENQIAVELNSLDGLNSVSSAQGGNAIDLSTAESAQLAIDQIDADLEAVSQQASNFGAVEGRFSAAIASAEEQSLNLQAARSRIGDADVAKEISKLIQNQIRDKANSAVISQANQSKKMVLSLLGGGKS